MAGAIEEALAAAVAAAVTPVEQELRALREEVAQLRAALPAQLLDVHAAAEQLGVSESTIRRQIREGELPVRRIGRSVRIDATALRPLDDEQVVQLAREARRRA